MRVIASHWLEGVRRDILTGGSAMLTRRCLVIHFTAGATAQSSIDFWRTPQARGACAHLVIDRDGTIIQCRPFNRTCGHAGLSRWVDPKTGKHYSSANAYGIGIELANAGDDMGALSWARKQPGFKSIKARHRNEPAGSLREWERFPWRQFDACQEVAIALVDHYHLDDVTSHDAIAPERKNDVGPAFDLERLRKACGFTGLPVVHWR